MTNTTEAALRDAINVLRQIGSMEARTHAQRHWFAEARRIAALSQPSPATTAWTIEQARELDAALIQTARNLAGACGATQSEMREARAEFLRDWLNNNISQPSPASSTAGEGADALAKAFCLLDSFAGDGLGHVYGNGQTIDADDTVFELCEAFGMEPEPGWWRRLAASLSPSSGEPASVAVEAEPVAWMYEYGRSRVIKDNRDPGMHKYKETPLYTALSKPTPVEAGLREDVDPCPACGALPCDWTDDPHKPIAGRGEAVRLGLEDAEYLERVAEEADDNGWLDWGAAMRQAAERLRVLAALSETLPVEREV